MLNWRRPTFGGRKNGAGSKREGEIVQCGGVKSLLRMCAIQEDRQQMGGVHNALISMRVVLLEPLVRRRRRRKWLHIGRRRALLRFRAMVLPVSRQPLFWVYCKHACFSACPFKYQTNTLLGTCQNTSS